MIVKILAALAMTLSVATATAAQTEVAPSAPPPMAQIGLTRGIDRGNFDATIAACSDFFGYSNGGWLKRNPIPSDQTSWGSFMQLQERNAAQLRTLIEAARDAAAEPGSEQQLVGDFYAAALDVKLADNLGAQPILPLLAEVTALKDAQEVMAYIARQHRLGQSVGFSVSVNPDFKDPSKTFLYLNQGGLGLPDRDDYLRVDAPSKVVVNMYLGHIARTMELSGLSKIPAIGVAEDVLEVEKRLATASLGRVDLREPGNRYAPITLAQAAKLTPHIDWKAYFDTLGLTEVSTFSLPSKDFFREFDALLADLPMRQWHAYLRWHIVRTHAPHLSGGYVDSDFLFYQTKLRGQQAQKERWKRAVELTSDSLGEPVGKLYVERHFPPAAKAAVLEMVGDLKLALRARLEKLAWMSAPTRQRALAKYASFTTKIGYPDQWRDYSGLKIQRDDPVGNLRRIAAFEQAHEFAKYGKPTDRSEWRMAPQTINAYYNPLQNEIVFPAAILQPPFFDPATDAAVNYGAIGAVIGHELLHGFDDKGSQYDELGRWNDWWTARDRKRFVERAGRLTQQFSAFVVEGLNVNGELTLGENIADLGGLTVAFDALQTRLAREPASAIDEMTPEQRFFLAWSQIWRRQMQPQAAQLQVRTDAHAPARYRVNGPLMNLPAFAKAFACQPGDAMTAASEARVAIW